MKPPPGAEWSTLACSVVRRKWRDGVTKGDMLMCLSLCHLRCWLPGCFSLCKRIEWMNMSSMFCISLMRLPVEDRVVGKASTSYIPHVAIHWNACFLQVISGCKAVELFLSIAQACAHQLIWRQSVRRKPGGNGHIWQMIDHCYTYGLVHHHHVHSREVLMWNS